MSSTGLTRQYIRDAGGKQIGVILPIEEYQALVRLQPKARDVFTDRRMPRRRSATIFVRRPPPFGRDGCFHRGSG